MQSGLLLHVAFILRGGKLVWFGFGAFVLFPFLVTRERRLCALVHYPLIASAHLTSPAQHLLILFSSSSINSSFRLVELLYLTILLDSIF
jgi:hypothetical protein